CGLLFCSAVALSSADGLASALGRSRLGGAGLRSTLLRSRLKTSFLRSGAPQGLSLGDNGALSRDTSSRQDLPHGGGPRTRSLSSGYGSGLLGGFGSASGSSPGFGAGDTLSGSYGSYALSGYGSTF